jgi:D-tyrosyl-tRNA(Tyr) deacylase
MRARVVVDDTEVASINTGLLVLLGIGKSDTERDADFILEKLLHLRVFPDAEGRMNLDVQQVHGDLLVVSQFTLMADCRRGRRPSFDEAASPADAEVLYEYFLKRARNGPVPVSAGLFQRHMMIDLVNDGPVTILIESTDRAKTKT